MLLPKFDYHEPLSVDEACQIMSDLGEKAKPLAGGTDLIVNMKKKILSPEHLVALSRIEDLRKIELLNGSVRIGACVTAAELAESQEIKRGLGALGQGAGILGSPLIRNLATVAGNLVSARPAADLPPPLMAYGAEVVLKSRRGERTLPLETFFQGPGQTLLEIDEILTEIIIQRPPESAGAGYIKLGTRKALEISLVNVAAYVALDSSGTTIEAARVVLGAVAPTPLRSPFAEKLLIGEKVDPSLFEKAGQAAAKDSRPIDDFRGSAQYRRDMVAVLTRRALNMALEQARRA